MVDFTLSEEQTLYQKTARDFADKEIRPAAWAIARMDRKTGQTPWDVCRPVYAKGCELGLHKLLIPEQYGGLGGRCLDLAIIMEELGAVDMGIAASYFNVSMTAPVIILKGGNEDQRRRWLTDIAAADDYVLASASSEPDVAGADSWCPIPDPKIGLKTTARREGGDYVLNGTKAGFSTNAGAARAFFIMARTDLRKPSHESTAMFFVPADAPGLTVGKKTELIGWKTAMHAPVYLDEVRVPAADRIGDERTNFALFFTEVIPYLAAGLASCYVGMARAAFEYALEYATQRISWGQPIINHQAVGLKLAEMMVDVEAARLMVWKLAAAADAGNMTAAMLQAPAAKTFAVDAAIRNAERTVKILGGYGVAAEYAAGGFLNDAWVGDACDGTRDMLLLGMLNTLRRFRGI